MELYWHIELYSGEIIKVKPEAAKIEYIQGIIAKQEGAITTPTRSIIVKDIKDFRLSDEVYSDQKQIVGANQTFNDPIYVKEIINGVEYESIVAQWVKRSIPRRQWDKTYRLSPGYRLLYDNDNYITMAFLIPVHQMNLLTMQELEPVEELRLNV